MIETSLLAGQVVEGANQQALPAAQQQDVSRFQDLMTGKGGGADIAIQPQSLDSNSVLQLVEPGKPVESAGLIDSMINQATKIDGTYHSLIDQMANRPNVDEYFAPQTSNPDSPDHMMSYPNVSVSGDNTNTESSMESMMNTMKANSEAALAYQSDMSSWAMSFRMWSTGVEVVSAAASKVSQGFQTLFRASG